MTDAAPVLYAVRLRLYPNAEQAARMRQWIGAARALHNHLLVRQKEIYEAEGRFLNKRELEQERQRWEAEPGCEWRRAAQSQTRQQVGYDLDRALRDFLKSRKGLRKGARLGFPRFKRKLPGGTFYVANTRLKLAPAGDRVELSKLGEMRVRGCRPITGRILGARVTHSAGQWYIAVQIEAAAPPRVYGRPSVDVLGVDVGLSALAVRSDGVTVAPGRHYRKAERRLARLQRRVSASVRGSRRRWKKVQRVARLHARIRDRRSDLLHHASARIVGKAGTICIETLNIRGMAKSRLAKGVADAAMGELHRRIIYKAEWTGREVVRADRYEPSTRACSECGQLHDMPLWKRTMRCDCGNVLDRDENSALNLKRIGRERRKQVGGVTAEPAPATEPTRGETGVQAATSVAQPVPVVEPRTARARDGRVPIRGRAPDIFVHVGNTSAGGGRTSGSVGSTGPGP